MSAVEREVSEGIPTDGRIFEPPQINRDNEKPRYLTFLGSLVDAEMVRSCPWMKGGGLQVSNPCLRYVKNFLRKGRITPLLRDTHDFLPYDLVKKTTDIDPLAAGYFAQSIPPGYVPPNLPPPNSNGGLMGQITTGGPSPYGNLVGKLALPGEQINAILLGSENMAQNNVPRGVIEHKSLIGHEYRPQQVGEMYVDPGIWQIQRTVFPTYPVLPVLLDDLERLLDEAEVHTSLRAIVDDYRESLSQFRDYAQETIRKVHHEMKESAGRQGYIFRYTQMDVVLLEQLGMARQDREIRQAATATPNAKLENMFEQWLAIQIEEKQANLDRMNRTGEVVVDQNTMKAAPITQAEIQTDLEGYDGFPGASGYSGFSGQIADAVEHEVVASSVDEPLPNPVIPPVEEFHCSGCGKAAGSLAGLKSHERACDKVAKE